MTKGCEHIYLLDEAVPLAATCCGIPVKINKLKLAEGLENLLDVALCKVEMQRSNI